MGKAEQETEHLFKHNSPSDLDPNPAPDLKSGSDSTPWFRHPLTLVLEPIEWIRSLSSQLNPSLIAGIFLVYGLSHGFAGSYFKVASDFYWKDVQRVNPSVVQLFWGFYYIPWVLKPVWGILTDVFPVSGYHRRPYFIIAGVIGGVSALSLALIQHLSSAVALGWMVGVKTGMAIGEVTIDACIARKSIELKALAPDMQSLCGLSSSTGSLVGYLASGVFVHKLGAQEALGLLTVSPAAMVILGMLIYELRAVNRESSSLNKLVNAIGDMARTIKRPEVWRPSLYMYLSLALSISTHEGQFYWYTNPNSGPSFSQEFVGMMYAVGALASIVGVFIYHKFLKDFPFRTLIFSVQLLYGVTGMLDVIFILRWNLTLGIPDYVFVIVEECVSHIISRVRWMPMLVLSTRLCPVGIEGTFFALLMCIDSVGSLSAKWAGGLLLHVLHVSRTDFTSLWLVVLIRNILRIGTLGFIFLIPCGDRNDDFIPADILGMESLDVEIVGGDDDEKTLELVALKHDIQV
ncbi:uncharacterized protein [Phyllobates terribilis]|uniref:uncharacterized protein n=1 Tax=Phyllobates terribilis TaxID=111132 RepID=UPI003CCB628C